MGSEPDGWHHLAVLAAVTRTPSLVYWAAFVALATAALFGVDALRRATARQVQVSATELLVRGLIRSERYALPDVLAVRVRAISRSSPNVRFEQAHLRDLVAQHRR